jgi:hypothetical protein
MSSPATYENQLRLRTIGCSTLAPGRCAHAAADPNAKVSPRATVIALFMI